MTPALQFSRRLRISLLLMTLLNPFVTALSDDLDNIIFAGTVRDAAGAIVVAAKVTARNSATGVERNTETDESGRYQILVNTPGRYELITSVRGFKQEVKKDIEAVTGRKIAIDFTLSPAGVNEQVNVSQTTAPLVDTTRTVVGGTIERRELESLPILNRDPLQLIFLLGGATEAPLSTADLADEGRGVFVRNSPEEAGLFSLTGAPATSNNITIDGLDNNDDRAARERIRLAPESIAEVQVITNQYAAEYGRASGGRVNLRTRGGANAFRGEAYFYFGDEALNANTYFRNARGLKRIPQSEFRDGGVFSGPLVKEKAFFLASYERLDVTDYAEVNAVVPVRVNPLFPLPQPNRPFEAGREVGLLFEELSTPESNNTLNARFDLNFSDRHNASVRADLARGENKRGFGGGSRLADTILIAGRDSDSIGYADNFIFTNNLVNQARFQYSRLLPRSKTTADSIGVVINEPSRVVAGAFTGSESAPAFSRQERRAQLQESLSYSRGAHLLKAGFDVQLVRSIFNNLFASGGQYEFETVTDYLSNRPARFIQRFDTESRAANNVIGLFLQDEWKIKRNVTLSLGVRWDSESILADRDNFSPRLAVAWDPFGERAKGAGKTVVRAGFGVFYNRALLRTIDDFSLGRSSLTVDSEVTPEILPLARFPSPILDRAIVERFGILETEFLRRISPDLEIPYTIQSGMGIEREVNKKLVITADYIFTRGAHLWRESNINAPVLPEGFADFTQYLMSRDFDNRPIGGVRPLAGANADVIRFDNGATTATTAGAVQTLNGVRLLTLGLNAPRSGNLTSALRAVRSLRPDPSLTQVELLESTGNSFYHGGVFSLRYRLGDGVFFRAAYTLSKLIDEGTTNTASPQDLNDRRAERALSLQDQRHRFALSGAFLVPRLKVNLAPILSFGSAKPFNIGTGFDRNLNDISNDRPNFIEAIGRPVWHKSGSAAAAEAAEVKSKLQLAPIGSSGSLPRNYGRGPGTFAFNLRASRVFSPRERVKLRPALDVFNVLNRTTFGFGAEFIDRDDADFLIPRRTQRPRIMQVSMKVDF